MRRWISVIMLCSLLVACASQGTPLADGSSPATATVIPPIPSQTGMPSAVIVDNPQASVEPSPTIPPLTQPFPLLGTPTPAWKDAIFPPVGDGPLLPEPMGSLTDVATLRPWRQIGFGGIQDLAFSPDSSQLAVATGLGIVYLEPESLEIVRIHTFTNDDRRFSSGGYGVIATLSFDQTGTTITVELIHRVTGERAWKRFAVADGADLGVAEPHNKPERLDVQTIKSPHGTYLAEFPPFELVLEPGIKLWRLSDVAVLYNDPQSIDMVFSEDETYAAMIGKDDVLRVLNFNTLALHERSFERFSGASFTPDGQHLLTVGRSLMVWDVVTGKLLHDVEIPNLNEHSSGVLSIMYDSTGKLLTILVNNSYYEMSKTDRYTFDISNNYALIWEKSEQIDLNGMWNYAFNPAINQHAILYIKDGFSDLSWHTKGEIITQTLEMTSTAMQFDPSGRILALGAGNSQLVLIDTIDHSIIRTIPLPAPLQTINFDPTGTIIVGKIQTGTIFAWRVADGTLIAEMADSLIVDTWYRGNPLFVTQAPTWIIRPGSENTAVFDLDSQTLGTLDSPSIMVAIGPFRRLMLTLDYGFVTLWGRK